MANEVGAADLTGRAARFAIRHKRALTIGGAIWFWASMAVYARLVSLPDLPDWARQGFFWTGVAYNAIWWGFIQPRIAGHVKTIEQKGNT
ncbi:MAG: hypothetical protein COW16_09530 [Sphingomonadales bacterium CG12_big_fil_rev_8_21_14_0_65_65_10]|nr:MAG: hypothetical protein COW16_09530 [Sphingomonadales bacterium CG12_big_fil_rev_8_21_14_0_65_65_10]